MTVTKRSYEAIVRQGAGGWGPDSETYAVTDATLRRAGVPELVSQLQGAVEALLRAHRLLDAEHGHDAATWADRERWTTATLDAEGGQ